MLTSDKLVQKPYGEIVHTSGSSKHNATSCRLTIFKGGWQRISYRGVAIAPHNHANIVKAKAWTNISASLIIDAKIENKR